MTAESFRDFLKTYKHVIPSGVLVKWVKDDNKPCSEATEARKRAIKFHPYYFLLGFTFPMSHLLNAL